MTMPDGRKSDVLDYLRMRFEVGSFGVTAKEIADTMNLKKAKANKCLEQLVHEGLVKVSRGAIPTDPETGGRPATLYDGITWQQITASSCRHVGVKPVFRGQNPRAYMKIRVLSPLIR